MRRLLCLSTVPLLASTAALAAPTAFPQGPRDLVNVKNKTTSNLLADTEDPHMVWVMPPTAGTVSPANFKAGNANLGFCQEMSDLQSYSRDLAADIKKLSEKVRGYEGEVKAKQDAYYRAYAQAEAMKTSNSQLDRVDALQQELDGMDKRLDELRSAQEKCGDNETPACKTLAEQIKTLSADRKKTRDELVALRAVTRDDLIKYNRAKAKADVAKEEYDNSLGGFKKIQGSLVESKKQLLDMYANLGKLEGGFANLTYDTGWDANVSALRQRNPDFRFEKSMTQNVRVSASFVGAGTQDSYLASLPAVLDYSINGKSYLPYGTNDPQDLVALPSKMVATMRLSLTGACPMVHPEAFDIPKSNTGVPVFGVSATYNYPASFSTKVKFGFNLYKVYELMQKSGSSSGLFHSSSWSEISENQLDKSNFQVSWNESDPDNVLPEAEKRKVEKEVKEELMERVLKQMATPIYDGAATPRMAPPVPEHGAMVLAKGLESTCGWYSYYCTGGAWLLRGLDAVFGSSESESNFRKSHDSWAEETWSSQTIRLKPGVMVFVGA